MKITDLALEAQKYTQEIMPLLGINKKREITRLLFEIAKRDKTLPQNILNKEHAKNFEQAKNYLLQKRYPKSYSGASASSYYLPKLDLEAVPPARTEQSLFYPKQVYIEEDVQNTPLAKRVKEMFLKAQFNTLNKKQIVGSTNYSDRKETLVIVKENFDFIKPCPCTKNCFCCGYNLINLGFGCTFECSYCFLQQYQNLHAIVLPANIQDFLNKVEGAKLTKGIFPYVRIGSGEFTDSLLFDHITRYSKDIVNFFRNRQEYFEFKTKSVNIDNLLQIPSAQNIVVGWSVNPQNIIETAEPLTPSLRQRLEAASKIAKHGYSLAFHFDPVILHEGWRENYKKVLEEIERSVPKESILWISVGTLRFNRELKKFIETRFKENTILDEEFLLDFDGKMRYPKELRKEVYSYMEKLIKDKFPRSTPYLCMETADLKI